ncbi:UNVERIFIED_CONTAM: hypothetical protein FKN15_001347 [Acipenser sinensis]
MSWVGCCSRAPLLDVLDDFAAPRTSSLFFLGSPINIVAAVTQQFHMPLMVYMEECVSASTAELSPSSQTYPLITNHGCFVDGQAGNSRFLPRVQTSEISLVVQAFRFTQLNTDSPSRLWPGGLFWLLLMAVLGALSLGYCMCMWRHLGLFSKSSSELLVPVPVDEMHTAVGTVSSSAPARQF